MDPNYLDLPDSEFSSMVFPDTSVEESPNEEAETSEEVLDETDVSSVEESTYEKVDADEVEETSHDTSGEELDTEEEESDTDENHADTELEESEEVDLDEPTKSAQSFQEAIMAPLKANGKDFVVKDAEEVRRLMQRGIGFSKKMEQVKPHLKVIRTLEENNLLDLERLNYLIDLDKKDPQAIRRLLKDSEINPLDLDMDAEDQYTPANHSVNDEQIEVENVLAELEDSPHFDTLINVVSNEWDKRSQSEIVREPQALQVIHAHMESGVFTKVETEVRRQKILGRLDGLTDMEAYWKVGQEMATNGTLGTPAKAAPKQPVTEPKPKPIANKADPVIANKRKAASSSKDHRTGGKSEVDNYLEMDDAAFLSQYDGKYS